MDEQYRLVFRGEVAEGQHDAVVQKRLGKALKLAHDKVAQLFSGDSVVLRRSVDAKTAAQFQAAFKQAGAKLRVQRIATEGGASAPAASEAAKKHKYGMHLLPVGSFILEVHERLPPVEVNVPISHLSLTDNKAAAVDAQTSDKEPGESVNVDHLSMAAVGAQLGDDTDADGMPELDISFEFELAEDGSWLSDTQDESQPTIVAPDFTLAEPGAQMSTASPSATDQPDAPDVSHLSLQADDSDDESDD